MDYGKKKKRTRRNQRGRGFFSGLAKIGKKLIKSKVAKQVSKYVVMPMAMDAMAKRATSFFFLCFFDKKNGYIKNEFPSFKFKCIDYC